MKNLKALLVLALLVALVLFEPLFLDSTLMAVDLRIYPPFCYHVGADEPVRSMNVTSLDVSAWLMPERLTQLERLAEGRLPLWNPGESLGQPLMATLGFTPFYPSSLLNLLLAPERAYAVSMALHLLLLGFGTFLLQRRHRFGMLPALFGGLTMMLCSYVTVHLQAPLIVRTIAWLPWVLLATGRLVESPGPHRAALLGLSVGLCLLAGFPQIGLLILYLSASVGLLALVGCARPRRALLYGVLAFAIGGALSSAQLVPASELLGESWRSEGWPQETLRQKSLAPQSLLGYVLPQLFGPAVQVIDPARPQLRSPWDFPAYSAWQRFEVQNNLEENALYAGLLPLVLALAGLLRRARPPPWLGGWALFLALAMAAPVLSEAFSVLPGSRSGSPKRLLPFCSFALAWLAGSGLGHVSSRAPCRLRVLVGAGLLLLGLGALGLFPHERWLFPGLSGDEQAWFRDTLERDLAVAACVGLVLLAFACLLLRRRTRAAVLFLLAATSVELVSFARHTNPAQPTRPLYPSTPGVEWLRRHGAATEHRILSFDMRELLIGSIAQRLGLRSCNGMTSLLPRRSGELLRAIEPDCLEPSNPCMLGALRRVESLESPILDMIGARYVVTSISGYRRLEEKLSELPDLRRVYASERERLAIYERETALGPAFLVEELRVLENSEERLAFLASESFAPGTTAVLEEAAGGLLHEGLSSGRVLIARPSPERIEIEVSTEGPGFLVVSETMFPGWRGHVDGEPVQIHRTNHALMGVAIQRAGKHRVVLRYAPGSFTLGAVLSALGLLATLVLLAKRRAGKLDSVERPRREQPGY